MMIGTMFAPGYRDRFLSSARKAAAQSRRARSRSLLTSKLYALTMAMSSSQLRPSNCTATSKRASLIVPSGCRLSNCGH
eukprot:4345887-Karenia_brevis.AAC.1